MLKNIKISLKIPMLVIFTAVICSTVIAIVVAYKVGGAMEEQVNIEYSKLNYNKKHELDGLLHDIEADLRVVASNFQTADAIEEFKNGWDNLLGNKTQHLQKYYITDNSNIAGEKDKLNKAFDGSYYSDVHEKYHKVFRTLLHQHSYYDIFLVDRAGNVVYSVYKEADFATNLNRDKWKDTDLAKTYRDAMKNKAGEAAFKDFAPYAPSDNVPASFLSMPVFKGNSLVGVLVYQMPINKINELLGVGDNKADTSAARHTGDHDGGVEETYLVGVDKLMRSQSFFTDENTILKQYVDSVTVDKAIAGGSGTELITNYMGDEVYSTYLMVEFNGVRWALVSEVKSEVVDGIVANVEYVVIIATILVIVIVGILGVLVGLGITKPLERTNSDISKLSKGEYDMEIANADRVDEIGNLARSALIFQESLIEKEKLEAKQKAIKENSEQEKRQAMLDLADRFENEVGGLISDVSETVSVLSNVSKELSEASDNSTGTAQSALSASEETSSNVQLVAASADELSSSVEEIANQMNVTNSLVQESVKRSDDADSKAANLSTAAERVNEVVEMISRISSEINLLALNATIESSRAGEAGRGFAVVANEVKNLANQTDKSIQEVRTVIESMKNASHDIVDALSGIKKLVLEISEASSGITSAVEEQTATTDDIAQNMQNASSQTKLISDNLQNVSKAATDASEMSDKVMNESGELMKRSDDLKKQVGSFLDTIRSA